MKKHTRIKSETLNPNRILKEKFDFARIKSLLSEIGNKNFMSKRKSSGALLNGNSNQQIIFNLKSNANKHGNSKNLISQRNPMARFPAPQSKIEFTPEERKKLYEASLLNGGLHGKAPGGVQFGGRGAN